MRELVYTLQYKAERQKKADGTTTTADRSSPVIFALPVQYCINSSYYGLCRHTALFQCYDNNGSQAKSKRIRHATLIPGLGEKPAPFGSARSISAFRLDSAIFGFSHCRRASSQGLKLNGLLKSSPAAKRAHYSYPKHSLSSKIMGINHGRPPPQASQARRASWNEAEKEFGLTPDETFQWPALISTSTSWEWHH